MAKRCFQVILDRVAVRLALPAGKRRAVVGDDEFQPVRHLLWRRIVERLELTARTLRAIEIALQDHLRRDLIDEAARSSRLLAGIAQGAIRRHRR